MKKIWRPKEGWENQKKKLIKDTFGGGVGTAATPYQSDLFFEDGVEAGADAILQALLDHLASMWSDVDRHRFIDSLIKKAAGEP